MLFGKKTQEELDVALLVAAGKHNFDKARKLLAQGASLQARDSEGNTVLHKLSAYCPESSHSWKLRDPLLIAEFVSFLVNQKFDMNARNKRGQTCLHVAVNPHESILATVQMMNILIERGAEAGAKDNEGKTILHLFAYHGLPSEHDIKWFSDIQDFQKKRLIPLAAEADNEGKYPHDAAIAGQHHALSLVLRSVYENALQKPVALQCKPEAAPVPVKWILVEAGEVARVSFKEALGYKLTETFNFHTRVYTKIVHNMETKTDTVVDKSFDEYPDKTIFEDAYRELTRLDGKADKSSIYGQVLDKAGRGLSG